MTDIFTYIPYALQCIITWLMTAVLAILATVTLIGFFKFIMDRRLNKYLIGGFILFIICSVIFSRIFGLRTDVVYVIWYFYLIWKPI